MYLIHGQQSHGLYNLLFMKTCLNFDLAGNTSTFLLFYLMYRMNILLDECKNFDGFSIDVANDFYCTIGRYVNILYVIKKATLSAVG